MKPPNPKAWLLDGSLVQLELVTATQLQADKLRDKDLLDAFRSRQLAALARNNGWPAPEARVFMSEPARPGSPLQAQVWAFTAPGRLEVLGVPVTGMTFATVAVDDLLLVASIPFRPGDDPQTSLQLFVSLLGSVEKKPGAPDAAALAERVRQRSAADPTCSQGP